MLTETVAALETQAVLNKIIATLEADATLTENVAALEHVETLGMMRPGHLRAEESNDATTTLIDGADFERLEDKDHVPTTKYTTKSGNALDHGGGRVKVAKPA